MATETKAAPQLTSEDLRNGLHVSIRKGAIQPRLGTVSTGRPHWIGCSRVDGELVWDEDLIVFLPPAELRAFAKSYRRAIATGVLIRRTQAEAEAQAAKDADKSRADAERARTEPAPEADAQKSPKGKKKD